MPRVNSAAPASPQVIVLSIADIVHCPPRLYAAAFAVAESSRRALSASSQSRT
jgi:hypothetical protein